MAKYTGTVLTNKGKELLVRAILGEAIVFTKVEIGKGILSPGTDKESLTSLIDSFKVVSITSTTKLANGGYRIRFSFNNKGFIDDTYLREVGVYARGEDGTEILYSYCNTDTPNLIPNESSGVIESVEDIITYISSAATINAVIDESHVYATIKDLIEGLATKENKFSKNGAFNKNFGTTTGTIMEGNKRAVDLGGEPAFTKKDAFNRSFSHVISSTSKILVASAYAVKIAYDKGAAALTKATLAQNSANSAQTKANQAYTLASSKEPKFNKKSGFNLDISHVVNSTSKMLVASAYAVKIAYDKALETLGLTNTNKNAIHNNTEQIENLSAKTSGSLAVNGNNGVLGNSYFEFCRYATKGDVVTLHLDMIGANIVGKTFGEVLGILPLELRPNSRKFVLVTAAGITDSTNQTVVLEFKSDGTVTLYTKILQLAQSWFGSVTYIR